MQSILHCRLVVYHILLLIVVAAAGVEWQTVFLDDFNGPAGSPPNASIWTHEIGYQRNNEKQYYTSKLKNANLSGTSSLLITAYHEAMGGFPYTSASLFTTTEKHQYGRITMRAKIPAGPGQKGTWPAFWLLGGDIDQVGWPLCGEIDVMEAVGYQPNVAHAALHTKNRNGVNGQNPHGQLSLSDIAGEWHDFIVHWSPGNITFFVDKRQILTYANNGQCNPTSWPYNQAFNLKLNLAVGGSWGGLQGINTSAFPLTFEIDYVKWEQPRDLDPQEPSTYPGVLAGQFVCHSSQVFAILTPVQPTSLTRGNVLASSAFTSKSSQQNIMIRFKTALKDITQAPSAESIQSLGSLTLLASASPPYLVINFTVQNGHSTTTALNAAMGSTASNASVPSLATAIASSACWEPLCVVNKNLQRVPQPVAFESRTLPTALPATSYDFGGPGEAFGDTTKTNEYNVERYRAGPDGVDIQTASTAHHSGWNANMVNQGGPHYIGYISPGEWLRYSGLELPYDVAWIHVQVSAANGQPVGQNGRLQLTLCGPWIADAGTDAERCETLWQTTVTVPGRGWGWEWFQLISPDGGQPATPASRNGRLAAGRYQLRIKILASPMTLHGIKFTIGSALPALTTTTVATTMTTTTTTAPMTTAASTTTSTIATTEFPTTTTSTTTSLPISTPISTTQPETIRTTTTPLITTTSESVITTAVVTQLTTTAMEDTTTTTQSSATTTFTTAMTETALTPTTTSTTPEEVTTTTLPGTSSSTAAPRTTPVGTITPPSIGPSTTVIETSTMREAITTTPSTTAATTIPSTTTAAATTTTAAATADEVTTTSRVLDTTTTTTEHIFITTETFSPDATTSTPQPIDVSSSSSSSSTTSSGITVTSSGEPTTSTTIVPPVPATTIDPATSTPPSSSSTTTTATALTLAPSSTSTLAATNSSSSVRNGSSREGSVNAAAEEQPGSSLSTGPAVGIAVGVLFFLASVGVLLPTVLGFFLLRNSSNHRGGSTDTGQEEELGLVDHDADGQNHFRGSTTENDFSSTRFEDDIDNIPPPITPPRVDAAKLVAQPILDELELTRNSVSATGSVSGGAGVLHNQTVQVESDLDIDEFDV